MPESTESNMLVSELLPCEVPLSDGRVCVLRELVEDDAAAIIEFLPKTHIETDFVNYLPGEFDWSVEKEREFLRARIANPVSLSMSAVVDGRIIGLAGAAAQDLKRMRHHAEIGLAILKEFWGQGIGRRMMELNIEWGRRIGLRKIYLRVVHYNERARSMYEALGFKEEARLHEDVLRVDGTYGHTITMALVYDRGKS
jgi:RimJ/RimL family protein N-acetyltransferase